MFTAIKSFFFPEPSKPEPMLDEHKRFLQSSVSFYKQLDSDEKIKFERRCMSFIQVTEIVGHELEVSDQDRLLVASSSVILAWGFDKWEYVQVDTVILVPGSFNENSEFGQTDSNITGLVDKRNVAIHEFAHLIDMADGDCDGLPKEITEAAFCLPWLNLVRKGITDINKNKSNIRDYGATNQAEFFAVVSEYFFEQPQMLKRKQPDLYDSLETFYRQNRADLKKVVRVRKKSPCPCGSGKRYKRCCFTVT